MTFQSLDQFRNISGLVIEIESDFPTTDAKASSKVGTISSGCFSAGGPSNRNARISENVS